MNKALGILLILISAALSLYAVYLMLGVAWVLLAGSFLLYCVGYHMVTSKRADAAQERFDTAHERVSTSIQEARKRGMN